MKHFFLYIVAIVFCATGLSYGSAEPEGSKKVVEPNKIVVNGHLIQPEPGKLSQEDIMRAVATVENKKSKLADEILIAFYTSSSGVKRHNRSQTIG